MTKRVFIIHGWDGFPDEAWFPWLKNQLEQKGFEAYIPTMPNSTEPKIEAWVSHISEVVGDVDESTFFVGHSIGCQAVIRYLEQLPMSKKVGGVVFVGGWFVLSDSETDEEKRIAKPWVEDPIDFVKVKQHIDNFFAIFSDNDEVIPIANKDLFEQKLGAKTIVEHNKGHFSEGDGIKEMPIVLETILDLSSSKVS